MAEGGGTAEEAEVAGIEEEAEEGVEVVEE